MTEIIPNLFVGTLNDYEEIKNNNDFYDKAREVFVIVIQEYHGKRPWYSHSDIHNSKLSSHSSKDFLETRIALPMRTILNSSCLTS